MTRTKQKAQQQRQRAIAAAIGRAQAQGEEIIRSAFGSRGKITKVKKPSSQRQTRRANDLSVAASDSLVEIF